METNKHVSRGGNAFFWGLIMGALLATLLSTKKGRQILRDLTNLGLEVFEDFVEERTGGKKQEAPISSPLDEEDLSEAEEDLESEITAVEEEEKSREAESASSSNEPKEEKPNGNGHQKKRLFRGIRRK